MVTQNNINNTVMETNEENNLTEETTPAPSEYEPVKWDKDYPDRLDFSSYPGVRSLHSKLVAILVFAVILPALATGFDFRLILFVFLPTGTLIWSSKQAVRNGSCDAIFLTRFTCFWLALSALVMRTGFALTFADTGPTLSSLVSAAFSTVILYLCAFAVLQSYTNKDVCAAFPLDERSMTTMSWIVIIATTMLPLFAIIIIVFGIIY